MSEFNVSHATRSIEDGMTMHDLILFISGRTVGELQYYWKRKGHFWWLEDIRIEDENDHRKGYGTILMRDFVRRIGPGRRVIGVIAHDPTAEVLYKRYSSRVPVEGLLRIEGNELADIPLVGLRSKVGIVNHAVTLRYNSIPGVDNPLPWDFYSMRIEGITGGNYGGR